MKWDRQLYRTLIFPALGYFRKRRGLFMLEQYPEIGSMAICDVGGSEHFWDKVNLPVPRGNITLYNITANETEPVAGEGGILADRCRLVLYDGLRLPVEDGAYDLCVSNSVIEHVAPELRENFAREIMRVAPRIMVQTPAFEFPLEPHFIVPFLHWLPRWLGYPIAAISPWRIMGRPNRNTLREFYFETRLLTKREIARLFPGCRLYSERFLFMAKSYYVVRGGLEAAPKRRRGSRATALPLDMREPAHRPA